MFRFRDFGRIKFVVVIFIVIVSYSSCSEYESISADTRKSGLNTNEKYDKNNNYNNPISGEDENIENIDEDNQKYEYYTGGKNYGDIRYENNQKYSEEDIRRLDKLFGYTGPTANDEPENLVRPCSLEDWQCIRQYFAAKGKCKPVYGPIPDPMVFDVMTIYLPIVNVTVSLVDNQVRGLSSAKVREFYFNKKSGNLVFAFDIQNFNQTVPRGYFRYRRTAKESIILPGFATINYRSATFTVVIPMEPDLRLDLADTHLDIQDGTPPYFISPEAVASSDPDVQSAFVQLVANTPRSVREAVFFQASLLSALYIQKNICDFGLKLISA